MVKVDKDTCETDRETGNLICETVDNLDIGERQCRPTESQPEGVEKPDRPSNNDKIDIV